MGNSKQPYCSLHGLFYGYSRRIKNTWIYLSNTTRLASCLVIGFALSFSSTVFAVKVLEDRSEMSALYGRIAIGILVMQDIFAVAYLTISTGKIPSPWAALVFLLPLTALFFTKY